MGLLSGSPRFKPFMLHRLLTGFVLGCPESSPRLRSVHSQLGCLVTVGILNTTFIQNVSI